jgi:Inorganic Pyrophosphatase
VWDDSRVRRSGEGGTETALDFIQNAPLYKQRIEAQAPQPAPVAAPSTEVKPMPVTAAPPPAIVQPAQPVQQKQEQPQAQGQVGLYAVGTNDPNPDMTVQSAQRIIESSRAMGINPVFLLPNQAGGTQYAKNSKALQDYLDSVGIQYQMPQYGDKDPLHMTPSWASGAAKSYETPFLAGDSNSVRLGIVGYGAKGDGKTLVHPESGAVLGRVGANSKAVADELERHLKWQQQNRTQRNTGGPVNVSKGQDTAGNFKKEHEKIHGIPVAVEVKEGHDRVKYEPDGSLKFKAKQYADYGAILGTKDADGMNTDVMVGPHKDSEKAYIIDQRKHDTGKFDEHKVMLGFNKRKKAIKAYTKSYADRHGKDRVQDVVKTNIAGLKKWLKHGDLKKAAAKDALINRALEVVSKKT